MVVPDKSGCEVWIDGGWQLVLLTEVHALYRAAEKRCPECRGRVRPKVLYSGQGSVATMPHTAHDGCTRVPKQYTVAPRRGGTPPTSGRTVGFDLCLMAICQATLLAQN